MTGRQIVGIQLTLALSGQADGYGGGHLEAYPVHE